VSLWVTFGDWRGNIGDGELQRLTKREFYSYWLNFFGMRLVTFRNIE
jgi:hypothetical protein